MAERELIGWREWIALPDLGGPPVKAKIDTGARTSALHAYATGEITVDGAEWIEFSYHPIQRDEGIIVTARAPLIDRRTITPSSGIGELRYVVETTIEMNGKRFGIELSLSNRDQMGFRMLLGRRALRGRFVIDPRRSYRTTESKQIKRRARKEMEDR